MTEEQLLKNISAAVGIYLGNNPEHHTRERFCNMYNAIAKAVLATCGDGYRDFLR